MFLDCWSKTRKSVVDLASKNGSTSLSITCRAGHKCVVRVFLDCKANVNRVLSIRRTDSTERSWCSMEPLFHRSVAT